MLGYIRSSFTDYEYMAQKDMREFLETLNKYQIGDTVRSTHTCVQNNHGYVFIVNLTRHGFAETTTGLSTGCLCSYSAGCLKEVIKRRENTVEELLTSEDETDRKIAKNIYDLEVFMAKFKKTKQENRWKLFLPYNHGQLRFAYSTAQGLP